MNLKTKFSRAFSELFFLIKIPFFKKTFRASIQLYSSPETKVIGMGSRCKDGQYVGFADYDSISYEDVKSEIKFIMETFELRDVFIFQTKEDGFHFVCLEKRSLSEWYKILKMTSSDMAFINAVRTFKGREWVLRFTGKGERDEPKFIEHLRNPNGFESETSTAHRVFLEKYYKIPEINPKFEDGETQLSTVQYTTANRIKSLNR